MTAPDCPYPLTQCSTCKAQVFWALTERGRNILVNPTPDATGNLQVVAEAKAPMVRVLPGAKRFGKTRLYHAHFETCPNAAAHRRSRRSPS